MKQPVFRFKGCTDDWEQRRLDDISADYKNSIVDGPFGSDLKNADYTEDGVLVMQSNYITSGIFDIKQPYFVSKEKANQLSRCHCKGGDILIAKIGANFGICNIIPKNIKDAVLSSNCMKVDLDEEHDNEFYMQYFNILYESGYYYSLVGITAQPALSLKFMKSLEVPSPSTDEQIKIASFLKTVDNLITLNQRKCDALKELKKGMLQKMFPADGEKVPEFRFKGFTGDWKQRKLGDVADIVGGGTPSTDNTDYWDGDINWYAPAEINGQIYADSSERKITQLGLENSSAKILPANKTVLFTSRAGIGKTAILRKPAATNQGFQSMVLNDDINPYFVFSMTGKIKEKADKVASGSTFAEISGKMLGKLTFMFPTKEEQDKIGSYFAHLDTLITLHQRKCDALKELKKGFLQKMFI